MTRGRDVFFRPRGFPHSSQGVTVDVAASVPQKEPQEKIHWVLSLPFFLLTEKRLLRPLATVTSGGGH